MTSGSKRDQKPQQSEPIHELGKENLLLEGIEKATRNIPNVKITDIGHFSAFDLVKYKKIIFTESSVKELEKRYQ